MPALNAQQREASEFQQGIAVVIAVPGSGKTLTMTHRIGNLVKSGVAPENILGLSFTRNAAKAMREKLIPILDDKAERVMLSTIHSFCYWLLKTEGRNFEIIDGKSQLIFARKIQQELKIKDLSVGMVLNEVKLAKNNLIFIEEFFDLYAGDETMTKLGDFYRAYEESKSSKMLYDFEDLLLETYRLLSEDDQVREKYQSTFRHLMVDEYQDTNPAQFEIIKLLADNSVGSSLFVVGDDCQSIYAFTGASVSNILNFNELFPDSKSFLLNLNYRSTPQILTACQNLISHNQRKIDKELRTDNKDGDDVITIEAATEEDEAMIIANEIKDLAERKVYPLKDIAVLYRANFQSRFLEECFSQQNIDYQIQNGLGFYQRREVKLLLDYLTLIAAPDSDEGDEALASIINVPNRYISRKFVGELEQYANDAKIHIFSALRKIQIDAPFIKHNVKDFIRFVEPLIDDADTLSPAQVIGQIRSALDYDTFVTDDDLPSPDDQKIQNIEQLVLAAVRYDNIDPFLEYTRTFQSKSSSNKDGVQLMTIHRAKGLEFPVCFVVGMVENIMPSKRGDIEEERRICFVAISRAKDLLYLTYPSVYLGQPALRSIFIDEIRGTQPIPSIFKE